MSRVHELDTPVTPEVAPVVDEPVEVAPLSVGDAIRLGSQGTTQEYGWGDGEKTACALTAAAIAGRTMWGA